MKLRLILLLILFSFILSAEERDFNIIGYLTKDQRKTTTINGMCVYLDKHVVYDYSNIEIFVKVIDGNFYEDFIYYGETSEEPILYSSLSLINTLNFTSKNDNIYYFKLPYPNKQYFYLSFPIFMGTAAQIGVYTGFPVWVIVLIILASIVIIFIILILCVQRYRRLKINNPNPIYTNTPDATNTTPANYVPAPVYSLNAYPLTNTPSYNP